MKRNKILFVIPCYKPSDIFGGIVGAISDFAESISKYYEIHLYTTDTDGPRKSLQVPLNKIVKINNVNVRYFHTGNHLTPGFSSKELIKYLNSSINDFSLVYLAATWQILGYQTARICRQNNVPYIFAPHGSFPSALRKKSFFIKNIYYTVFLKNLISRSAGIHITSLKEKEDSTLWLNFRQTFILPNIVNFEKFKEVDSDVTNLKLKYKLPTDKKILLNVGRADWKKRNDLIIDYLKDNMDYIFVFVGENKNQQAKQWLDLAKALNVNNRVHFLGTKNGTDLLELYKLADIFCLLSENENFGLVVAEAMLCNTPVIISKEVGIQEYLTNIEGCIIVEKSVTSFSEGLKQLSSFKLNNIETLRNAAIKLFGQDTIAFRFAEIINDIINNEKISNN